jgi:hypothetical protein
MFHVKFRGEGGGWGQEHNTRTACPISAETRPRTPAGRQQCRLSAVARSSHSDQELSGPFEYPAAPGGDQHNDHTRMGARGRTPGGGPSDGAPQHTAHKHDTNDSWRRCRLAPSKRAPSEPRYRLLADRHANAAPEPCQTSPWWAGSASTASRQTGQPPRMLESVGSKRLKWGPDWARSSPARTRKVASARRRR